MTDLKVNRIEWDQTCSAVNPDWFEPVVNTFKITKFENNECLFDDPNLK